MPWAPAYASTRDLATYMDIGDTEDDSVLAMAVEAASRVVDHATNRQFGVVATVQARTYNARWSPTRGLYKLDIDDLMDATGLVVTVSGAAVASAKYQLWPYNAAAEARPWTQLWLETATPTAIGAGPPTVQVTGLWGWTTVPATVKEATLIQAARFARRPEAQFGVAGSPEMGNELRLLAKADPDVEVMLRDYRRNVPMVIV